MSTTNIHSCLVIPEILTLIFTALLRRRFSRIEEDSSPWTSIASVAHNRGLQTLIGLARTCKAFHGPAIDLLWHFQPSLFPLIRCLPSDAYSIERNSHQNLRLLPVLTITRDLQQADWKRVEHYAHRIRVVGDLEASSDSFGCFDSQVLPIVWSRRPHPGQPFLPRIRSLYLAAGHFKGSAYYPRLLIGPALQLVHIESLIIENTAQSAIFDNISSVLKPSSPTITKFYIISPFEIRLDDLPNFRYFLRGLEGIETLNLRPCSVNSKTFFRLASLPTLKYLDVSINNTEIFVVSTLDSKQSFTELARLTLTVESLKLCSRILRKHQNLGRVESLSVNWANDTSIPDLDSFLKALHHHWPHSFLKTFHIGNRWHKDSRSIMDASTITLATITPLLSFINMVSVHIDICTAFDFNDDALISISKAWPHLRFLNFCEKSLERRPRITLPGLLPLLANCPELEDLCLLIDATLPLPSFSQLGEIIPRRQLHTLGVCTSRAREASAIAEFLTVAFPALKVLYHEWEYFAWENTPDFEWGVDTMTLDQKAYRDCWDTVDELLKPLMPIHLLGDSDSV